MPASQALAAESHTRKIFREGLGCDCWEGQRWLLTSNRNSHLEKVEDVILDAPRNEETLVERTAWQSANQDALYDGRRRHEAAKRDIIMYRWRRATADF